MCISWAEMKINEWILKKMEVNMRLLTTINCRKMAFIGQILREKATISDLLLGMVYDMRGRERSKVRNSDNIKAISDGRSMVQLNRIALHRRKKPSHGDLF